MLLTSRFRHKTSPSKSSNTWTRRQHQHPSRPYRQLAKSPLHRLMDLLLGSASFHLRKQIRHNQQRNLIMVLRQGPCPLTCLPITRLSCNRMMEWNGMGVWSCSNNVVKEVRFIRRYRAWRASLSLMLELSWIYLYHTSVYRLFLLSSQRLSRLSIIKSLRLIIHSKSLSKLSDHCANI